MDSFKGCLSSLQAGQAAAEGIREIHPDADVEVLPFADGGEGTLDALLYNGGQIIECQAEYSDGTPCKAIYGIREDGTAIIESARVVGLTLIKEVNRDPMHLSTKGIGTLIKDAYSRGVRDFIITLGGSGTNDGGAGMLAELGIKWRDIDGGDIEPTLKGLEQLASIEIPDDVSNMLNSCRFTVACDVTNPLCGPNGASVVFGPQKGLKEQDIQIADDILRGYALLSDIALNKNNIDAPGAGAAGGLGYALISYMNAKMVSGADIVTSALGLHAKIATADIVISGEGRVDRQTLMGKGVGTIKKLADKYGKRLIIFGGSVMDESTLKDAQMEVYSIDPGNQTLEELMDSKNASINIKNMTLKVLSGAM